MHELIEKILASGNSEALKSPEALQKAAEELGFSTGEVAAAMDDFDGFPLDEDELLEVAGGGLFPQIPRKIPENANTCIKFHAIDSSSRDITCNNCAFLMNSFGDYICKNRFNANKNPIYL